MHYLAIFMHEDKGEMGERQTETEGKGACERQGKEREERERERRERKGGRERKRETKIEELKLLPQVTPLH